MKQEKKANNILSVKKNGKEVLFVHVHMVIDFIFYLPLISLIPCAIFAVIYCYYSVNVVKNKQTNKNPTQITKSC